MSLTASQVRSRVEAAIATDIAPALSAHAGGIRLVTADRSGVRLEFLRSCGCCYFRKACAVNLVEHTVHEQVGDAIEVEVEGVDLVSGREQRT